ncbi:MAG: threonine--tRNA ligase [Candidatus Yanofskybacteria bacterium]|nr:threonine--tRNA ligase [Candidatus Yanofskybacteria bacterium]
MQPLEHVRHSLAHLLAAAVLELYPDAKRAIGPAIENGFYYDIEFSEPISDEDLPNIEKKMRELLPSWNTFENREIDAQAAKELFKNNPYKEELIDELASKGETITIYTSGNYEDLCRGGHVENAKDINPQAFKLTHTAGAYWRGNEKNKMLTRIYGLAFNTEQELKGYLEMLEEAKKRDHKVLGPQLDLFTFSDLIGPGLPLFTPKGTIIRNLLDEFVWGLRKKVGYQQVDIPHITKKDLYERSGHWDKFKDDLFRVKTREDHEFAMKPMNCPHHTQIYARKLWSYRELPQRYANTTKVYRDEQSGELAGLTRVRSITQDDAHVFCRMPQVKEEFLKIWDIVNTFYSTFGISLRVRVSLHDPASPEKYLGDKQRWEDAENILREIVKEKDMEWFEGVGEAAFYGPKLDFMGKDAIGREHQVATIQIDMNQPERFDLTCMNEKGEKERIVMIHAAIMGSIERFMAVLIEHTAGQFPTWLAPVQVAILPISDKQVEYAQTIAARLEAEGVRFEISDQNETIGKKIRAAELQKIPYILIVGEKEIAANSVSVRRHGQTTERERGSTEASRPNVGDTGQLPLNEFITQLKQEISQKS